MKSKFFLALMAVFAMCCHLSASAKKTEDDSKGYLTGSFETTSNYYHEDLKTKATVPDGNFGSNNYLKLDYYNGRFSAGVQMEAYTPVLVGFPSDLSGAGLTNYYVNWRDDSFSVTAGTFYEQFGSGLLFRSWEDRALGLNNAVMGARVTYSYGDILNVKALWGMPRFGMKFSQTQVRGGDFSFALSNAIGLDKAYIALEGSVLDRYEALDVDRLADGCKPNTIGWSGRLNVESNGFFFKGEYVDAGQKYFYNTSYAGEGQMYHRKKGNAQLIETGYNGRGLGVNVSLRRLEWMDSKVVTDASSAVNMINYVPAMCTQYTYMLTTLHPYGARTGDISSKYTNSGEMGGQIDVFYNFRRGTAIGGKRGMKVHANFSTYYAIAREGTFNPGNMLFTDLSVDVEKQWTKEFKSTLLWSMQEYSPSYGANKTTWLSNIFVADLLYKFTPTTSARMELQYLVTFEDQKDWMAALLEFSFAPHWCIYASDMWNHGSTGMHYYNGGVSYSKSRTKVTLGYGRYKAGYICSGGVCRQIPAYTGANLAVLMSF
jgi:hypothetical protein